MKSLPKRCWRSLRRIRCSRELPCPAATPFSRPGNWWGICREVHAMGKDVMTYTGYTYEELMEMQETDEGIRQLLEETDTLVDGRFILAQRDLTLIYKGSRNQRIIDMNRTRAEGKLVLDPVEEENLRPEE